MPAATRQIEWFSDLRRPAGWAIRAFAPKKSVLVVPQRLTRFALTCRIGYRAAAQNQSWGNRMSLVSSIWLFLRAVLLPCAVIAAENLAPRQLPAIQSPTVDPHLLLHRIRVPAACRTSGSNHPLVLEMMPQPRVS